MNTRMRALLPGLVLIGAVAWGQTQLVGVLPACGGIDHVAVDDWDGDGKADVARTCSNGQVVLVSSATGATLASLPPFPVDVRVWDSIADVDLDGRREVLVGHPGAPLPTFPLTIGPGWVAAYSFASPAAPLWQRGPTGTGPLFGFLAVVGDLNGDGVEEVAAGRAGGGPDCPDITFGLFPFPGVLEILSGASGAILRTHTSAVGDRWPVSATSPGDVNGDGFSDYIVVGAGRPAPALPSCLPPGGGSPLPAMSSRLTAFSGATGSVIWNIVAAPGSGAYVKALGDFDADLDPDLLVVINFVVGPLGVEAVVDATTGAVVNASSFPGATLPLLGTPVGDVDGDGAAEFVAGDHTAAVMRSGMTGAVLYPMPGVLLPVVPIADFDGDGRVDYAMPPNNGLAAFGLADLLIISFGATCPAANAFWSGTGCGAGGPEPGLVFSGPPYFGWSRALAYVNGPPLGVAHVFLGAPGPGVPLGGGCTVAIDLTQPYSIVWSPSLDASGSSTLVTLVPPGVGLAGVTWRLQGAHLFGSALALTAPIDLVLGF